MAIDFNKLKENAKKSAEDIKKSMASAGEKFPGAMKDLAKKGQDAFGQLKDKSQEAIANQKAKSEKKKAAISDALKTKKELEKTMPPRDALRIILYLMAADGVITQDETDQFHEIGVALDEDFSTYESELVGEGRTLVEQLAGDEEDLHATLLDNVGKIIHEERECKAGVSARVLLWDLLTVAYSDEEYSPYEKKLIRYISKGTGVDYAIVLEMEQTLRTLHAVESEEEWLKDTDRQYSVVEERVRELDTRKEAIMNGVYALMAD